MPGAKSEFMRLNLDKIRKVLEFFRLWPLSLAEKCRLAFGAAVVFILFLALLLPYIWMGQLTKKGLLDTNKAKAETLLMRLHFRLKDSPEAALPVLSSAGTAADVKKTIKNRSNSSPIGKEKRLNSSKTPKPETTTSNLPKWMASSRVTMCESSGRRIAA